MLRSLTIDNYALIDHLEMKVNQGLTVITGETGAGKSIIMGALSLILGQRADAKAVRAGAMKCVIEACFDVEGYGLQPLFEENDLEYDAAHTIVRREIYATGKSRAFVNDIPVQLAILKTIGEQLIDIHSQHQNLLLGKDTFQREVLDGLAHNEAERTAYQTAYEAWTACGKRLAAMRQDIARSMAESDYIRFQYAQLDEARLQAGEQKELEEEQHLLSHAEDIKSGLCEIGEGLNGVEDSMVARLKQLANRARSLVTHCPALQEVAERLETDYIDLKDIADEIDSQAANTVFDPERLAYVEERLSLLYGLQKKHGCADEEALIAMRDDLGQRLMWVDNSDEALQTLEREYEQLTTQLKKCARTLTATRQEAAGGFEKKLVEKVAILGMPNVRFEVHITPLDTFASAGGDEIGFYFSANKNQPLKPAGEVASGGEISRLMLTIKALIAHAKTLPTVIFDEIDTGVSGDIADRMGEVMKEMSKHLQVLTITHLPQVAAKGDTHLKVYKEDTQTDTITQICSLTDEQRLEEVARMLSGASLTEQAMANARVLLKG